MRKISVFIVFLLLTIHAKASNPDTVTTGIYITSIHDINFVQQEYEIHFWVWFRYKKKELNFLNNLEIPTAKSVIKLYQFVDTSDVVNKGVYALIKYECTMNDIWRVSNFPFDNQVLRFRFENSQFDKHAMVFKEDDNGDKFDTEAYNRGRLISGWNIDSFVVKIANKEYKTSFGSDTLSSPAQDYSYYRVRINVSRPVLGLFFKTFLGMYIAFLIAFVCFFIHSDGMDSRFGISVGSLFAVIGNKYIIDSHLPDTTDFSLVDTLHGLTLAVIFVVVAATIYSLHLVKKGNIRESIRLDYKMAIIIGTLYLTANIYFIIQASRYVYVP